MELRKKVSKSKRSKNEKIKMVARKRDREEKHKKEGKQDKKDENTYIRNKIAYIEEEILSLRRELEYLLAEEEGRSMGSRKENKEERRPTRHVFPASNKTIWGNKWEVCNIKVNVQKGAKLQKPKEQEGTSKTRMNDKQKSTDRTVEVVYIKAARTNKQESNSTLSEEDIQRILAGGPRYKVKEAEVAFYKWTGEEQTRQHKNHLSRGRHSTMKPASHRVL